MDLGRACSKTNLILSGFFSFFEESLSYPPRGSFSMKRYCCPRLIPPLDSPLPRRVASIGKLGQCRNAEQVEIIGFENA